LLESSKKINFKSASLVAALMGLIGAIVGY
jgi:hypothetical protein